MTTYSVEQVSEAHEKLLEELHELESSYTDARNAVILKLKRVQQWLWKNAPHTADSLIEEYLAVRDRRAEIKKAYENDDEYHQERMDYMEVKLLELIDSVGSDSLSTSRGTAYTENKVRANCSDWTNYWAHIQQTGRFDLLEKRVSQKPIKDMIYNGEELPPGINVHKEKVVIVRRK